ncbi:MAG: hypothetical protein ACRC28_08990 [Clostridium sp.]|uniref:hypothetical protein n=1 Tax=Clostridium sp. TaxID=1506 RepID=UPI003F37ED25
MAIINSLVDKNGRYEVGFFGTPLSTNSLRVIVPFTNVGGTVVSTLPNNYGSTSASWSVNSGGWVQWNPLESIIPKDSTVEYAFLVWSTAYYPMITPAQETLANTLPISFKKPDGTVVQVTPDPTHNMVFNGGWRQFTHGAEITSIMQDNQYGEYKITGVPTGATGGSNGLGGWGVYILYAHKKFPYRNANLNVTATGFNEVVTISNLVTPVTGPVNVKVYLASVQGDSGYSDSLLLNGTKLSGPFNPVGDFMNSNYVDYTGLALQTIGSLMPPKSGAYASYADQTVISNNTILKNGDSTVVLKQDNASDWAGVSFLGVLTDLNAATINPIEKSVDKGYATAGSKLVYTLIFKNIGSVPSINVNLIDTLPTGLTFVSDSILLNGSPYPGNITTGITLPDINVNQLITVMFTVDIDSGVTGDTLFANKAIVNYDFTPDGVTLVNSTGETNFAYTTIVDVKINETKFVDKTSVAVGETVTYTVVIDNQSKYDIENGIFKDTIPTNGSLVSSTLKQDGASIIYNALGSSLPNKIFAQSVSTITYQMIVTDTLPENPLVNIAGFDGTVSISNGTIQIPVSATSNAVSTDIKFINISINKSVDKFFATIGATITYTIEIKNTGNINGSNLIFKDTIPNGTSFVPNSVTLDGNTISGGNPQMGINIGTILPNEVRTITFMVVVQ